MLVFVVAVDAGFVCSFIYYRGCRGQRCRCSGCCLKCYYYLSSNRCSIYVCVVALFLHLLLVVQITAVLVLVLGVVTVYLVLVGVIV